MSVFDELEEALKEAFPGCKAEVRQSNEEVLPPYHVRVFDAKREAHVHVSEPDFVHIKAEVAKVFDAV